MLVMYFSACNMEEHEGIDPGSRRAAPTKGDQMDWTDEYNQIVCEFMAQQVRKGNKPNIHLNILGFTEVSRMFFFSNDRN
jgi:hypothetical protein